MGEVAGLHRDDGFRERLHHAVRREPTQIAAIVLGGVHRLFLRDVLELVTLLEALHDARRERLGRHQDVPGVVFELGQRGDLILVFRAELLFRGLLVLEIFLGHRLLEDVEACQDEHVRGVRGGFGAILLRFLGNQVGANEVIERLRLLVRRQLGGFLARDGFDVEVEEILGNRGAIDGRQRGRGIRGCGGGRAFGLARGERREDAGQDKNSNVIHVCSQ